jgi:hypothetical protein
MGALSFERTVIGRFKRTTQVQNCPIFWGQNPHLGFNFSFRTCLWLIVITDFDELPARIRRIGLCRIANGENRKPLRM